MSVVAVVSLCVGRQCCVLVRRSSVWRVCQRIYYDDCVVMMTLRETGRSKTAVD